MRVSVSIRFDILLCLVSCCTLYMLAHSINCLISVLNDMMVSAEKASYAMVHCHGLLQHSVLYSLHVALPKTLMLR